MGRKKATNANSPGYRPLPKPVYARKQHPQKKSLRETKGLIPKAKYVLSMLVAVASGKGKKKNRGNGKRRRARGAAFPALALVALTAMVLLISGLVRVATAKNAYTVYAGEKKIGVMAMAKNVTKEGLAESLFDTAIKKLESEYGAKLQVVEKVTAEPVHAAKKEFVTAEHIIMEINKNITYKIQAAVITVDGQEMAVLKNQEEAEEVQQGIIAQYVQDEAKVVSKGFVEQVTVEQKFVDKSEIDTPDTAHKILTAMQDVQETYTVQPGDTLWGIANKAGMSLEGLLSKNPGLHLDSVLKVGQDIHFYASKPLLSVKTVEKETYTEAEPMPVELRENPNEFKTYSKLIQQGKDGEREVTAHITKVNGYDTGEREEASRKVTVEPIAEIREVGTSQTVPKR